MSTWMKALKNQEILSMSTFKKSEDYMGNQLLTVLQLIKKLNAHLICPIIFNYREPIDCQHIRFLLGWI